MTLSTPLLRTLLAGLLLGAALMAPREGTAQPGVCCVVPDNGAGTADHPPACPNGYAGQFVIIDGLPPNTTIDIAAVIQNFAGLVQIPGGGLGGNKENWTASAPLTLTGTGALAGFNRNIAFPISAGETHSAPRVPFAPNQTFASDLWTLQGQVVGDPDFALLRVTAGSGFGLPSPGQTMFTTAVGGWAVDSFFDIFWRVDFVGQPGSPLQGMSGSTTGIYRFEMCHADPTPVRRSTWGGLKISYR